jgi:hypothetical protein
VTFTFTCAGRQVRVLVVSDVLECVFGADADGGAWLAAFLRHQSAIADAARRRFSIDFDEPVVLRRTHFQELLPC